MNNFKSIYFVLPVFIIAFTSLVTLVACDKQATQPSSSQTVGQKLDIAIDKTNEKVASAGAKINTEIDKAGSAVSDTASSIAASATATANKATVSLADTAITASINADLLKDAELSVLKIDVDTKFGAVTLNGLTPSETARLRAGRIATAVKGVTNVANNLVVKKL